MSEENVELVRRIFSEYQELGLASFAEFMDPDIEFHTDPLVPEPGVYEGKEAVIAYMEGWIGTFKRFPIELKEVIDLGDEDVLMFTKIRGQLAGQGAADTELDWCVMNTIRGGKVTRIRSFFDRNRALEAAGLSE